MNEAVRPAKRHGEPLGITERPRRAEHHSVLRQLELRPLRGACGADPGVHLKTPPIRRLREPDGAGRLIDPHRPLIARRVPVELDVIREEQKRVVHAVSNDIALHAGDKDRRVPDPDAEVAACPARAVHPDAARAVRHVPHSDADPASRSCAAALAQGNLPVDAVALFASEVHLYGLANLQGTVARHGDFDGHIADDPRPGR